MRRAPKDTLFPRGFTLIELLVVIVILGILMAVAVPTFLAQQTKAQDSRTQQYLTTAFKAIRAGLPNNNEVYPRSTSMVSWITASEPELTAASGSCTTQVQTASQDEIYVDPASTSTTLTLCARSQSGNVWKLSASDTGVQQLLNGTLVPLTFSGNEITDVSRTADAQGDGLTNDSSTGVWEATANEVLNGGFESGTGHWAGCGAGQPDANFTLTADSSIAKFGSQSLKVVAPGLVGSEGICFPTNTDKVAFASGSTYTFSVWAKGSGTFQLAINENDSSYNFLRSDTSPVLTLSSNWQRYTFTSTAGASSAYGNLYITTFGAEATTFWLDGIQFEQKPFATPYIETNGTASTRSAAQVQAPASLLNVTQGWVAARVRMGVPSSAGTTSYVANVEIDANNRLALRPIGSSWQTINMVAGDQSNYATMIGTYQVGDLVTAIFAWTSATLEISIDGSSFSTVARAGVPSGTITLVNIGSLGNTLELDGDILWFACGNGTLTNADTATINGFGSTDPKVSAFPVSAQTAMVWDGTSTTGSLK